MHTTSFQQCSQQTGLESAEAQPLLGQDDVHNRCPQANGVLAYCRSKVLLVKLTSWKLMKAYPTLILLATHGIGDGSGHINILAVVGKVCEVLADEGML
jgi:hypothetical protein